MMNFDEAKAHASYLWTDAFHAGTVLKGLKGKGNSLNLTPDHIKDTPEWKLAKARSDAATIALQQFNQWFTRKFKAELAAERNSKRYAALNDNAELVNNAP